MGIKPKQLAKPLASTSFIVGKQSACKKIVKSGNLPPKETSCKINNK